MIENPGEHCAACQQQCEVGVKRLSPDGRGTSGILIVGDSPWNDEMAANRVFSGAAGSLLDRVIWSVHRERDEFSIANSMWCKPPRLGYTDSMEAGPALAHCRPYLDEHIAALKPRCIVPMGNVALERICDVRGIEAHHGYVHETPYGLAVPTFHPSYLIRGMSGADDEKARNMRYFPVVRFAMQRALEVAQGKFTKVKTHYLLDPRLDDAQGYIAYYHGAQVGANPKYQYAPHTSIKRIPLVFIDLETTESSMFEGQDEEPDTFSRLKLAGPILRCSLSLWPGTAISYPWQEPWIEFTKEVLSRADSIAAWNGYDADFPKLIAEGIVDAVGLSGVRPVPTLVDAMWAWHFLQSDLPKALGFVAPFFYDGAAWKHLSGTDPAYYNAVDSDAGIRCLVGIREALEGQRRWERFTRHCTQTNPILSRMGDRGIIVNPEAQGAFQTQLKEQYRLAHAQLQLDVPESLKPRKKWKRAPKDMAGVYRVDELSPLGEEQGLLMESAEAGKLVTEPVKVTHYERIEPFNPHSAPHVTSLIKHLGLKMPMKRGENRETTESKYLRRFGKKFEVFRRILDCRERQKMLSTYMWKLDAENRVHTTYGYHPSTWRKSSRAYNLQNIPKRGDLARDFRRMLVAASGHVLIEADAAAIEAVLVGYAAGSSRYIRLAKAGVHAWLTAQVAREGFDYDLPDAELVSRCKAAKKHWPVIYEAAKRVVHGSNYLLSPFGIYDEYQEYFPEGQKQAKALQDLYFSLPPGQDVKKWQQATMERAHKEHYLDNHFQYRHYFYDVFAWNRKARAYGLGSDAKRAVAFGPQSDASAVQTEVLLRLAQCMVETQPVLDWLRLIIHDSFVLEVPEVYAARAVAVLKEEMTRPLPELGGLDIGVEVKQGLNLADMSVV